MSAILVRSTLRRWQVNAHASAATSGVGTLVFGADQLSRDLDADRPVVALHEALRAPLPRASDEVEISVPEYRGKTLIPMLAWLVATRLAGPDATVSWRMGKRQGPDSMVRVLTALGWRLRRRRDREQIVLGGRPPDAREVQPPPEPASFTAQLGAARLQFAADYGVFSPHKVDDGTRLLFDVAMRRNAPLASLADIGVGYGALALGLVRNGLTPAALGTDVDCLALLLAERNADAAGVPLSLVCSADPRDLAATELTVCNVPTHLDAAATAQLMHGLVERARNGRVQIVVHATLEQRYRRQLEGPGLRIACDRAASHVVLTVDG